MNQLISAVAAASKSKSRESESHQRQRAWLGYDIALVKAATVRDIFTAATRHDVTRAKTGDGVLIQRHFCLGRQGSAANKCQIAVTADEVMGEDVSGERRAVEGRGAADSPIDPDICTVTYILHDHIRGGRGDERAIKPEIPLRSAAGTTVENEDSPRPNIPSCQRANCIGARTDNGRWLEALERDQVPAGNGEVWRRADNGIHSEDRSIEINLRLLRQCGILLQ